MTEVFRFAGIEVRPLERVVLVEGKPVSLGARAFDLLLVLIECSGRTIPKSELLDRIWPGLVVEENNLQVQVWALRKALGAEAIVTIPGRGYRLALTPSLPSGEPEARRRWRDTPDTASAAPVPGRDTLPRSAVATNLPARLPPLYGREADIAAVRALLLQHAVVTVTGPGGIGKTRLAQSVASGVVDRFSDGVWWIELAAIADPALVPSAVGRCLGAQADDSRDASQSVRSVLATQNALLVIDNCEHLVDAVASLVETIAAHAAGVRMLVTSQVPLKVADEHVFRLGALALPAADDESAAAPFGATELFVARARAVDPRFDTSPDRMLTIAKICRRLDGIPLAIELAAARLPLLGLDGLRQRLDEQFKVLSASSRMALRRHQTLRGTLDWSHSLLAAEEQAVLRRLGVFAGTFTLEAAQRVAGDGGGDRWSVLDHLGALVDRSMVLAEGDSIPRYRLLETTRAYALERLAASGEMELALHNHADSLIALLSGYERMGLRWRTSDADRAALAAELDNVRAALTWAEGDPAGSELLIPLAAMSMSVWLCSDTSYEGLQRCFALRDRLRADTPAAVEGRYWLAIARLGEVAPRAECFVAAAQAAAIFRSLGDDDLLYDALASRAASGAERGEIEAAGHAIEEALRIERADMPPRQRAALAWSRQRWMQAQGRMEESHAAALQQAALYREDGFEAAEMAVLGSHVAGTELALGRPEVAESLARHALERLHALDAGRTAGRVRSVLVLSLTLQGRSREAIEEGRRALPLLRADGDESRLLEPLALNAAQSGRAGDAARIAGFVDAARARTGEIPAPGKRERRQRLDALLAATLAPAELAAHRDAGSKLSADLVFKYGFGDA